MREYDDDDDNIRLYAPVLQRVIVLAAVIIAVPVMMWTITTFIRSYVARPRVPTFQQTNELSPGPPLASNLATSPPPAPQPAQHAPVLADAGTTAGDARAALSDVGGGPPKAPVLAPPLADAGPAHSPPPVAPVAGPAPNPAANPAPSATAGLAQSAPSSVSTSSAASSSAASGSAASGSAASGSAASGSTASGSAAPSSATSSSAAPNPPSGSASVTSAPAAAIAPSVASAQAAPRIAANASGAPPAAPGNRNVAWPIRMPRARLTSGLRRSRRRRLKPHRPKRQLRKRPFPDGYRCRGIAPTPSSRLRQGA